MFSPGFKLAWTLGYMQFCCNVLVFVTQCLNVISNITWDFRCLLGQTLPSIQVYFYAFCL